MILAITRENEKLIYEVCKENGFEIPQILTGVDSLKRFAIQELKNLNNYKQIIIDVDSTKESEEEIIQSIVAIKSMYNIRVIVLALGHEEGDRLLSKLFNEGIYNSTVCLCIKDVSFKYSFTFSITSFSDKTS